MSIFLQKKIGLVVCDMAGTIINEKGLIYKTMFNTLKTSGYAVSVSCMDTWPGKDKKEVLKRVVYQHIGNYKSADAISSELEKDLIINLEKEYFKKGNIELVNKDLLGFFDWLRINGIKVALNTGYPKQMQEKIIDHFNLDSHIDNYISSEDVVSGRPSPYMINRLMEKNLMISSKNVAKIGDTKMDMKEGVNAHCGLTIGVLTGYDNKQNLIEAGADIVVNNITDLDNDVFCDFYL